MPFDRPAVPSVDGRGAAGARTLRAGSAGRFGCDPTESPNARPEPRAAQKRAERAGPRLGAGCPLSRF